MAGAAESQQRTPSADGATVRERILQAAFAGFTKNGYAATSTLEIATRARVSKRELYALVGNKREIFAACITERAKRLQMPAELPVPRDRDTFAHVLASFGAQLLREVSDPTVIAAFRVAIAEALQAPEVAQALDSIGRETSRNSLRDLMTQARASGLIDGRPADLAKQFGALLLGDLMVSLLLGVTARPNPSDIGELARDATAAFLQLHPPPDGANTDPS